MENIKLSKYVDENGKDYFIYATDKGFTEGDIEEYICSRRLNDDLRKDLKKDLYDFGNGVITYGQYTGKIDGLGITLYHNSRGKEFKPKDSYSIFYILVACKKKPDDIRQGILGGDNLDENDPARNKGEDCELLNRAGYNNNIMYVRRNNDEKDKTYKVNKDGNIVTIDTTNYYIFPVLLGLGQHKDDTSYKFGLRNATYLTAKGIEIK